MPRQPRLKIYPGVTAADICGVLRKYTLDEKMSCLAVGFQDLHVGQ